MGCHTSTQWNASRHTGCNLKEAPVRRRLTALAVTLACVIAGVVVLPATPALAVSCSGWGCDYTDPKDTGCATGAVDANSIWINNSSGQHLALLKVRWSPTCKTNWGSIAKATGSGFNVGVSAARPSDGAHTTFSGGTGSQYYSDQLYGYNMTVCAVGYIYDVSGKHNGTVCA
jgi:hypothetical protein